MCNTVGEYRILVLFSVWNICSSSLHDCIKEVCVSIARSYNRWSVNALWVSRLFKVNYAAFIWRASWLTAPHQFFLFHVFVYVLEDSVVSVTDCWISTQTVSGNINFSLLWYFSPRWSHTVAASSNGFYKNMKIWNNEKLNIDITCTCFKLEQTKNTCLYFWRSTFPWRIFS